MVCTHRCSAVLAVLMLLAWSVPAWGVTPAQREKVNQLRTQIRRAGNFYTQGKFRESADDVKAVQAEVDKLAQEADADLLLLLEGLYSPLERAHALLELEGFKLPPLVKVTEPARPLPGNEPGAPAGTVSFVKQVAPMLVAKCGNCHVSGSRGDFNIPNYAVLMQGGGLGKVVFAGDPDGSRLVEVIETGDMPRGNLRVSTQELAMLKTWINEGARFDGADPNAPLGTLAAASNPQPQPTPTVQPPTGNETVSFARDVAPILADQCLDCHGANNPRNNFSLVNFQRLLRGGDNGSPVIAGNAATSLLVQKLKGNAPDGARMPLNRPALPAEQVATIEKWITEGAKFDGPSPTTDLARVAAVSMAANATHEELAAKRGELAEQSWRLALAGVNHNKFEGTHVLLIANMGQAALDSLGAQADGVVPKVAEILGADSSKPLVKGRVTLFFIEQRYDYSEFGRMVEQRSIPKEWRGHWNYSVVDAYGVVMPGRPDDFSLEALLGQQLAGVHVASLGEVPRWFAEGSARMVASRLAPKTDPRIKEWDDAVPTVISSLRSPDDLLGGKLPPEETDLASYSLVKYLAAKDRNYKALLADLRNGQNFDAAFAKAYGGPTAKIISEWASKGGR